MPPKEVHSQKRKDPPIISNYGYKPEPSQCLGDCTKCIMNGKCSRPHAEPKKLVRSEEELKKIMQEELGK